MVSFLNFKVCGSELFFVVKIFIKIQSTARLLKKSGAKLFGNPAYSAMLPMVVILKK